MGATSVTGVGPGSSEGQHKGPGNGRNVFVPLRTPHVVAAGVVTLSSGSLAVSIPVSETDADELAVVATSQTNNAATVSSKSISDGRLLFTLTGTGTDKVAYSVMTVGVA